MLGEHIDQTGWGSWLHYMWFSCRHYCVAIKFSVRLLLHCDYLFYLCHVRIHEVWNVSVDFLGLSIPKFKLLEHFILNPSLILVYLFLIKRFVHFNFLTFTCPFENFLYLAHPSADHWGWLRMFKVLLKTLQSHRLWHHRTCHRVHGDVSVTDRNSSLKHFFLVFKSFVVSVFKEGAPSDRLLPQHFILVCFFHYNGSLSYLRIRQVWHAFIYEITDLDVKRSRLLSKTQTCCFCSFQLRLLVFLRRLIDQLVLGLYLWVEGGSVETLICLLLAVPVCSGADKNKMNRF